MPSASEWSISTTTTAIGHRTWQNRFWSTFKKENLFRTMKPSNEQVREKKLKLTRPILERTYHKVVVMTQDARIMANKLMRKAVNYTINQWKFLKNILKDEGYENIEQFLRTKNEASKAAA